MGNASTETCIQCGAVFTKSGVPSRAALCSAACRKAREEARRREIAASLSSCEVEGCETPRRSSGARWCELHYMRNRRHGAPERTVTRMPNGTCYHCGASAPKQRQFCSELCRRRDRLGAPGRVLACACCDGPLREDVRLDALFCSEDCYHEHRRAKLYGTTARELRAMRLRTPNCEICGAKVDRLHVDHCHEQGHIRGLLCGPCNLGLGVFGDDPDRLRVAAAYLDRTAQQAAGSRG